MNKQLIVQSDIGPVRASIEDLVSSKLNQFNGWQCQAGVQNLYIDFDGHVFISNCASSSAKQSVYIKGTRPWGYVGEIDNEFTIPVKGVVCPFNRCGCGSDVVIDKWAPGASLVEPGTPANDFKDNIKIFSVRTNYEMPKQVLWDISRRCNYDCSYCWPGVHNTTDEHKSYQLLKQAADRIIDKWAAGGKVHWYFGGGEPTLNPAFEQLVDYLTSRDQWVMLVSNGSQGPAYWNKNADNYNTLVFSAHFEFMKPSLFIKNAVQVINTLRNNPKKLGTFIVKLMTKPGEIQQSKDFVNQLKADAEFNSLPESVKQLVKFDMVPLRGIHDSSKILRYTEQELQEIIDFNGQV